MRTLAVGRSTRTAVTSLPGFTSRVPDLAGSIDAGLWLSEKEQRDSVRTCVVSGVCGGAHSGENKSLAPGGSCSSVGAAPCGP